MIIDELFDFLEASIMTTQYTTQTFLSHCAQSPGTLKKIREEFDSVTKEHSGAEMGNKSKREVIDKVVQFDTIFDLEYLNLVIMEALRIQAPATTTTIMHLI